MAGAHRTTLLFLETALVVLVLAVRAAVELSVSDMGVPTVTFDELVVAVAVGGGRDDRGGDRISGL